MLCYVMLCYVMLYYIILYYIINVVNHLHVHVSAILVSILREMRYKGYSKKNLQDPVHINKLLSFQTHR